jgi:glycosyltransferase involved in cell wall biosynthesis
VSAIGSPLIVIDEPYFLAVCVPIKIDRNGTRWCSELWAKDLALHLEYLTNLTLACPCFFEEPASTDKPLNLAPFDRLQFVDLPGSKSYGEALRSFPTLLSKIWHGVRRSNIVHAGFGGWPISEGWLTIPIGKLQGKFIVSYVESSFWRASASEQKWRRKIKGSALERLNQFCVKIADLRFFTSKAYEGDFLGPGNHTADHAYVTPATWIDESIIRTDAQADQDWSGKSKQVRFLFAGRLLVDKGVRTLLDAIEQIANDVSASITIIGEGPLASECEDFVARNQNRLTKVKLLKPVAYGRPFYDLLRRFDAVIVPSISDEQPRLIFDAFSQGIPVIGSDTGGICEVIDDDVSGKLFRAGDASDLARLLRWACAERDKLRSMGLAALTTSRQFTHRSMHERRSKIISAEFRESAKSRRRRR